MVNSQDFSKRLEKVINYYGESASSFAEKIGVQRSSISHILSGRNKPSLEFVMKVLSSFPEVELYWLLNGKGSFPKQSSQEASTNKESKLEKIPKSEINSKKINRIVIFYNDGTFEDFEKS